MSPSTSRVRRLGRPVPDPDAVRHQKPPYLVQVGRLSGTYQTMFTFQTFGRAFLKYSNLQPPLGHKKRLINGEGTVIAREIV